MRDSPARPWVAMKQNGVIICAHCNCMAGAGEACSHVAALLYSVMTSVRIREETACTSVACQWLAPSITKKVTKQYYNYMCQCYACIIHVD